MLNFTSEIIKTDITAIRFNNNNILAGIGGTLFIFDQQIESFPIKKLEIFTDGTSIHHIEPTNTENTLLLCGEKNIAIICNKTNKILKKATTIDWILAVKSLKDNLIGVILMKNCYLVYNANLEEISRSFCSEKCILYSALIYEAQNELIAFSGTVFSEILVWKPNNKDKCPVLAKLIGHNGVIFSISYNASNNQLCTSSDDRSTIIWQTDNLHSSNLKFEQKCKVFGHSSRIFRCLMLADCFISAGEDGLVNVWALNGELMRKFEKHQGSAIWSLDSDGEMIATGGGDTGLCLFPIKNTLKRDSFDLNGAEPKKCAILASGSIVVVTNDGELYYFNGKCQLVGAFDEFRSYCLLEASICGTQVALAGFNGHLSVFYEKTSDGLLLVHHRAVLDPSRILALHWLHCHLIAATHQNGVVHLIRITPTHLTLAHTFHLPATTSQCTTSACQLTPATFLFADRKSNLYVCENGGSRPIQTIKRAHTHLGATSVRCDGGEAVTVGRDATLRRFRLAGGRLVAAASERAPFAWLARCAPPFVAGFGGGAFCLWQPAAGRVALREECGGGHRSWDVRTIGARIWFVYVKDRRIRTVCDEVGNLARKDPVQGYHSREINALKALVVDGGGVVLVSGGEDTALRVSTVNGQRFECVSNRRVHLSSIRALCWFEVRERCYLLFSGGGRRQIIVWRLQIAEKVICEELHDLYDRGGDDDPETRIMDLASVKIGDKIQLFAACSDGTVNIYDFQLKRLVLRVSLDNGRNCITKLQVLRFGANFTLVTMSTDGFVTFWDLSTEKVITKQQIHQSGINSFVTYRLSNDLVAFLTGGDDNLIKLTVYRFGDFQVEVLATWCDFRTHCAQITGAFINEHYIFTCSIDQKLAVFKWKLSGLELQVEKLGVYMTSVSDAQGLEVLSGPKSKDFHCFIYGKGLDYVKSE